VIDDVVRKKPMLGAVLGQTKPVAVGDRVVTISLTGNHFHREMLADRTAREIITQAVRRWVADADRFEVAAAPEPAHGPIGHPAVQAVITEFDGDVVAVRARSPEGEGP
jgi:hypothetical protein